MLKKTLYFLLLVPAMILGQTRTAWEGHFSYNNVKDISKAEDALYAAAENAFFRYDLTTNELKKISSVNGLSGEDITTILFDVQSGRLALGHTNGLLEVYDESSEEVTPVVGIIEKETIAPNVKSINHILEFNGLLYLSCDFGISLYNIANLEFDDTYFIGPGGTQLQVRKTTIFNDFIYAATNVGVYRAPVMSNSLIDFDQWTVFAGTAGQDWKSIDTFGDKLIGVQANNSLYQLSGTAFALVANYSSEVKQQRVNADRMVLSTASEVYIFDSNLVQTTSYSTFPAFPSVSYNAGIIVDDQVFMGTTEFGMLRAGISNQMSAEEIHPNGPLFNNIWSVNARAGQVWAVHGDYTETFDPSPRRTRGVSYKLAESLWEDTPLSSLRNSPNLVDIEFDPNNENVLYISSFWSGVIKIDNTVPDTFYSQSNSSLESVFPTNPEAVNIRVSGSFFDRQRNLWVLNSRVDNAVNVLRSNGQWQSYSLSSIIPDAIDDEEGFAEGVVLENGIKFFASAKNGIIGFFENGGPSGGPMVRNINGLENNMPDKDVRAVALDERNNLWIGTQRGLRVIFDPENFFDPANPSRLSSIIISDNGEASELFFQTSITDIKVDGANNKWIGTNSSGLFYISSDGQETLLRFTKDNSPLPTNAIQDISIDDESGEVFIATPRGMVSFKTIVTSPSDNLSNVYAFPNPVRPDFSGNVTITGLVDRANVKVTDIEGNLVFETTSTSGSVEWDLTAFGRHKVASGVYLILATNEDGTDTKISKVMVVR